MAVTKGLTKGKFKAVPKEMVPSMREKHGDDEEEVMTSLQSHLAQKKAEKEEAYLRGPLSSDSDADGPFNSSDQEQDDVIPYDKTIMELEKIKPLVRAKRLTTNKPMIIGQHRLEDDEEELPTLEEMAQAPVARKSSLKNQTRFQFTSSSQEDQLPISSPSPPHHLILESPPPSSPIVIAKKQITKLTSPPPKPFKRTRFESPLPTAKRHKSIFALLTSSDDQIEEQSPGGDRRATEKATNLFTPTSSDSETTAELLEERKREFGVEFGEEIERMEDKGKGENYSREEESVVDTKESDEEDDMDAWLAANVTVVD